MRMRVVPVGLYGFGADNSDQGSNWVTWLLIGVGIAAVLGFVFGRTRRVSRPARRLIKETGATRVPIAFVEARKLIDPDVVATAAALG